MVTVAVDAMGGDNAPSAVVEGCVQALAHDGIKLLLVGNENMVKSELKKYRYDEGRVSVVHAPEVITNDEAPTTAIKRKKQSSIVVGLNLLKEGKADAFVSAGSTGALLTGATLIVGRIKGIQRPALATLLPNEKGYTFLLDSGANVDCKPVYLAQFGMMGALYMEHVMDIKNPRVGLVAIGAEKEKGNTLTKEAYELLESAGINFVGNVEAREIPHGAVDVAVCDGFVGNVILKYSEGFAKAIFSMIKKALMGGLLSKIGAILAKGAFKKLKDSFDPSEVGGAPFLGLNSLVVKAHGSSDAKAVKNAVLQCKRFVEKDIVGKLRETISIE